MAKIQYPQLPKKECQCRMKEKKSKKKLTKKKKKFFIIASCYVAIFLITSVVTATTLSWFSGSTWQSDILYMGGPVYIEFNDDTGNKTSGANQLKTETPPGWTKLYPGMNISFEARAVIEGREFTKPVTNGEYITYTTTGAVLRAKIRLTVTDPSGSTTSSVAMDIYNSLWSQLKYNALNDTSNDGVWIFDVLDSNANEEDNYFYYCVKDQEGISDTGDYLLKEVGGKKDNDSIGFLNNSVVQLPSIDLKNEHADCTLTFVIVFEAVQAYFSVYDEDDLPAGDPLVGHEKTLNIANSRIVFKESQYTPENGYEYA